MLFLFVDHYHYCVFCPPIIYVFYPDYLCILAPIICFELAIWYQIVVCSCEPAHHPIHEFPLFYANPSSRGFEMKVSIISWYQAISTRRFICISVCICIVKWRSSSFCSTEPFQDTTAKLTFHFVFRLLFGLFSIFFVLLFSCNWFPICILEWKWASFPGTEVSTRLRKVFRNWQLYQEGFSLPTDN